MAFPAGATLPKPNSEVIVAPSSIGGVHLNQTLGAAKKAWGGKPNSCDVGSVGATCVFGDPSSPQGAGLILTMGANGGKVSGVGLSVGVNKSLEPVFTGPLLKFKAKGGIGLGTTLSKVKKVYPSAIKVYPSVWDIPGKGKSSMRFTARTTDKDQRITQIYIVING